MVTKESCTNAQPTEDNAAQSASAGAASSLASTSKPTQPPPPMAPSTSGNDALKPKSDLRVGEYDGTEIPDPMKDPGNRIGGLTSDASRCPYLEECMFPRYLSLDCKQMDEFSLGRVKDNSDTKNLGRIYIEALHLKEFLKSPEEIESQNKPASKGSGKRGRKNADASSKKKGRKNEGEVTEKNRLSQAYFGGLEGKRTWLLANGHRVGKGGGIAGSFCQVLQPTSTLNNMGNEKGSSSLKSSGKNSNKESLHADEELDKMLSSEVKLEALRRNMRLHDHTIPYDSSDDTHPEPTPLENLVKPLPGYTPPLVESLAANSQISGGRKVSGDIPTSSLGVLPMDVGSAHEKKSDKKRVTPTPMLIKDNIGSRSAAPSPVSSSRNLLRDKVSSEINEMESCEQIIITPHRPQSNFDRAMCDGKEAALAANKLLESFRRNRRNYWDHKLRNGKAPKCAWCPTKAKTGLNAKFGVIKNDTGSTQSDSGARCRNVEPAGDDLIQCLECGLVGSSPTFLNGKGGNHAMLHFLMSGHRFGVTCGPRGEIFSMGCGDFVYHEVFDQERERIFLEQNIPSLSWRETPILRGVDPSSFIVTPENGAVWRGMMATYPSPVSAQLVQASRFAVKRMSIFRGDDANLELGPKAAELCIYRQHHVEDTLIPTPVGMYNLGNTCFMNAILQCMIHCKPLQEQFIQNLAHPYQSCYVLRRENNNASCLTSEMDKMFLEYYGSAVGIDTIAALEEQLEPSSHATPASEKKQTTCNRGHPLVPSSLLAEAWKNRGMKQVAGHGQHDAQEFFSAFVESLAIHAEAYQQSSHDMRQVMHKAQIKQAHPYTNPGAESATDFIRKIYTGTLRSVLICQKCGCKRTQTESFSNVSLPLVKESKAKGKPTVQSILDQFTRPETLADPVHCPSCSSKTKTLKQRSFSTLPPVLCLHLKRFDAAANKKTTDFVSFPAHGLNMGKYLPHWRERGLLAKERNNVGDKAESPKVLYDLFATVNHKGTINQGHYVAHVKSGSCWYLCNDAFVATSGVGDGEKAVLSSEGAYMLFYQKR